MAHGQVCHINICRILRLMTTIEGTAGYGIESWAIGQSYADDPVMIPAIYDPDAPLGNRWTTAGLSPTNIPRMYHSVALLLPDGKLISIFLERRF